MRGSARAWVVAAMAVVAAGLSACGSPSGVADQTAPGPPSSSPSPAPSFRTATTGRPVARYAGFTSLAYASGDNWLCGPRAASSDRCLVGNEDVTVIEADGRLQVRPSVPPADPPVDCFYVYPTLGFAGTNDLAMARDTSGEDTMIFHQAARLREHCRVYSPLFRSAGNGGDAELAYSDVREAFRFYLARWNGGRRLVLFGHAQGADHLARLVQEEFEGDEEIRALLLSAVLVGARIDVPTGARTGGTFRTVPTCATATETGCVVAWMTSTAATPRDVLANYAGAPPGRSRVCVNPAAPAGGPGLLTAVTPPSDRYLRTPTPVQTPFVEFPDLLSAECVTNGGLTTLVVRPASTDPGDARRPGPMLQNQPTLGLRFMEVMLAMGTIVELIGGQVATLR